MTTALAVRSAPACSGATITSNGLTEGLHFAQLHKAASATYAGWKPYRFLKRLSFRRREDELDACKAEAFADWQSGKRKWFGRPGRSIAPHEEIPWSACEHLTITWRNSTGHEAITGNVYFDIYTVPAKPMSAPEPQHDQVEAYSSDRWLAAEIKRTPPPSPDRRKHGWRTEYAQSLARKMRDDKNVKKPLEWRSIRNRLPDLGL
jgi:hypothetical protein